MISLLHRQEQCAIETLSNLPTLLINDRVLFRKQDVDHRGQMLNHHALHSSWASLIFAVFIQFTKSISQSLPHNY